MVLFLDASGILHLHSDAEETAIGHGDGHMGLDGFDAVGGG
jgi:hypothetical protein